MTVKYAECVPTRLSNEVAGGQKKDMKTRENPAGKLSILDFEMAGFLFLFLVMEAVCSFKTGARVALFNNNQPAVSWVGKLAPRSSVVAGQLIRALALRMKKARMSPINTHAHPRSIKSTCRCAVVDVLKEAEAGLLIRRRLASFV